MTRCWQFAFRLAGKSTTRRNFVLPAGGREYVVIFGDFSDTVALVWGAHASRVSRPASRRTPVLGLGRDAQACTRDACVTRKQGASWHEFWSHPVRLKLLARICPEEVSIHAGHGKRLRSSENCDEVIARFWAGMAKGRAPLPMPDFFQGFRIVPAKRTCQ